MILSTSAESMALQVIAALLEGCVRKLKERGVHEDDIVILKVQI